MATFTPDAPEKGRNLIDEEYARGLDQGLSQKEQGRAGVFATSDKAEEARRRLKNNDSGPAGSGVSDDLQKQEEQGGNSDDEEQEQDAGFTNKFTGSKGPQQQKGVIGRAKGLLSGKKGAVGLAGGLMGVGGIGILLLLPMLLSLKMFGLVANMTEAASAIPSYAVEQRTEYLITRAYATWLIRKGAGDSLTDADTAAVFCKNGSISCSLTWTRINNYFDERYDLSNWAESGAADGNRIRNVTVKPKGMDRLGANARSWTINVHMDLGGNKVTMQMDEINSNAQMKREIRDHVNQRMYTKSTITRYIARKALMKRYGVTNFRGFEKLSNNYAEKKAAFKTALVRNTVGKISPKASTYLACFSGGSTCENLKELYASEIDNGPIRDGTNGEPPETPEEYQRRLDRNKALQDAVGKAVVDDVPGDGVASKFISKQLVTKLAGGAAIVGVIDQIMGAIGTLDSGALETVVYSIRSTAYVNYAFGDESGIVPNIEKIKAGESIDTDLMPILAEQFENIEQSPIFQAETGLMNGTTASGGGYARTCDKEGEQVEVILKGSYECPERQMVQNMTGFMENNPYMNSLAKVAEAWNATVGRLFDWVGGLTSWVMDNVGISGLIESAIGDRFEDFAGWVIGLFFDVPTLGDEATGDQNYDALSAGVWVNQNGLMENGVEGGDLLGAGGELLTNEQIAAVQTEYRNQEIEQFNSQSYLARMFNTDLSDSFASKFLASIPVASFTSAKGIFSLPSAALANLPNTFSPATQADLGPMNPHNIPLYGYPPGHPALSADPTANTYTTESCQTSSKEREDSYELDKSKYPIKVYKKSDPCALERMAIGNILYSMGVTDDTHSFEELTSSLNCGPFGGNTGGASGTKVSSAAFKLLVTSYSLPVPKADAIPDQTVYGEQVQGYEDLLKQLQDNPKAAASAQAVLNGEKKWKAAGGDVKEYLTSAWLWFESGQGSWPDPYAVNCNDNDDLKRVSFFCRVDNFQSSGFQVPDRVGNYLDVFNTLYSDDELPTILAAVKENSSSAARPTWDYTDPGEQTGLVAEYMDTIGTATTADIATSVAEVLNDGKKQFITLMLGKDPAMTVALNSFAVSDADLVKELQGEAAYGYIKGPEKQLIANMMMALYMFDGQGPTGGASCSTGSNTPRGNGTGIAAIFNGNIPPITQPFGPTAFSKTVDWYDYSLEYGFSEPGHTGIDYGAPDGTQLYSPVNGTVVVAGGSGYFKDDRGDEAGMGELNIKLDNGHSLILGHMKQIDVNVGDKLTVGQPVGLSGTANGDHVHVEYRIPASPDSPTISGARLVDPREYL